MRSTKVHPFGIAKPAASAEAGRLRTADFAFAFDFAVAAAFAFDFAEAFDLAEAFYFAAAFDLALDFAEAFDLALDFALLPRFDLPSAFALGSGFPSGPKATPSFANFSLVISRSSLMSPTKSAPDSVSSGFPFKPVFGSFCSGDTALPCWLCWIAASTDSWREEEAGWEPEKPAGNQGPVLTTAPHQAMQQGC